MGLESQTCYPVFALLSGEGGEMSAELLPLVTRYGLRTLCERRRGSSAGRRCAVHAEQR